MNFRRTYHLLGSVLSGAIYAGALLLICTTAASQNLFVLDNDNIYEFTPGGVQSTFASGLGVLSGLAVDRAGNLFVSGQVTSNGVIQGNNIIKIKPDGTQIIVSGFTNFASAMAVNKSGSLFVAPSANANGDIYELTTNGASSVFAGGVDQWIEGLAFNGAGDLFASCQGNESVIEITPDGAASTFATGSGLVEPAQLVFDNAGDLFVADSWPPGYVYEYTSNGVQSIVAAGIGFARALAIDGAGNLFVSELVTSNGVPMGADIIKIKPDRTQSVFASGLSGPQAFVFQPVPRLQAGVNGGLLEIGVSMPFPYYSTILQASADLVNWVNIDTNTPPFTFTNSMSITSPVHFYRAVLGP